MHPALGIRAGVTPIATLGVWSITAMTAALVPQLVEGGHRSLLRARGHKPIVSLLQRRADLDMGWEIERNHSLQCDGGNTAFVLRLRDSPRLRIPA